jgi:hypothetical protein
MKQNDDCYMRRLFCLPQVTFSLPGHNYSMLALTSFGIPQWLDRASKVDAPRSGTPIVHIPVILGKNQQYWHHYPFVLIQRNTWLSEGARLVGSQVS